MLRFTIAAVVALVALSSAAEARANRNVRVGLHPECNVTMPCAVSPNFLAGVRSIEIKLEREQPTRGGKSLSGIVAPLAAKAAEITAACGSTVISAVRHTRVRGTGRWSLHRQGKAVDMAGNPSCIYRHLAGWSGGYTTDYGRVRHVHISYDAEGGREWGLRFAHGGGRRAASSRWVSADR